MSSIVSLLALLLYAYGTHTQIKRLQDPQRDLRGAVLGSGLIAVSLQSAITYQLLITGQGIHFGLFATGSLIAVTVILILLLSSLRQKLDNLFIGVYPMAALTLALATWWPLDIPAKPYPPGVIAHILLSLVSYSVLTLAAFQAILLSRQERALKQHHTRGLINSLPPLQVMERLLFDMILGGFLLLTLALLSGFVFTEDLFAQHLAHKTLLSIISWIIFATLLGGRLLMGWRSRTALRWTLTGFIFLMLAFFGSKAVLELILGQ